MNVRALGKIDNLRKLARKDFAGQNLLDALNMLAGLECLFGGGHFSLMNECDADKFKIENEIGTEI